MNERIRELADRAEIYFSPSRIPETGFEYQGTDISQEDLVKFAELIIRECAFACERFGESGDGYTCSAEIFQHFGVEE